MSWIRGQTIGHGSTAAVSVATCRHSDEVFAVKSMELSKSEFLQREQRIFSTLNCPQIVEYKGYDITCEENKVMFNVAMEFMPGGSVADAARKRGGRFDEPAVRRFTREIVQGLVYLHCNGIVHCDIKSRNILLGKSGAKIADFGCSKWISDTGAAAIGGTPLFMAPEVAQGKEQGFPADIWSLGCTVIEMATGGSPWPNITNPATLLHTIAFSGESPPVPHFLSDQAKDFLKNCLRRDPRERWTAKQLLTHPFLQQFDTPGKQNQEPETISPTSVLDQGIWRSSMAVQTTNSLNSPKQRLRQLCSNPESMSDWNESSWITVRRRAEENIVADFSREQSLLLLGDSVSCCTSCTDSSILRQKFVGNGQTLGHQKERVVNQLPLFYTLLFLLLSLHFIPIPHIRK